MKHTEGKWIVQNHYVVSDRHEKLEVIAVVGGVGMLNFACGPCDIENTANTFLIAAAPELLEACRAILATEGELTTSAGYLEYRAVEKAIARAEGATP